MRRIAFAALPVLVGISCSEPPPFDPYDNSEVLRAALAPNAVLVTVTEDWSSKGPSSSHNLQSMAKIRSLTDGYVGVLVASREDVVWDDSSRKIGLVRGSSAGLKTLELSAARSVIVPFVDESVVVACSVDVQANVTVSTYLTHSTKGFLTLSQSGVRPVCGSFVVGRGADSNKSLLLIGGSLLRWEIDRDALTLVSTDVSSSVSLPNSAVTRFLDEPVAGEIAFVTLESGTLTYRRAGNTVLTKDIVGLDGAVDVFRGADGALRIVSSAGLWRWAADSSAVPEKLADIPAPPSNAQWQAFDLPGGAYAWTAGPNPLNPAELYPTAAIVRWATDEGFDSFEPSPTPCCDPTACRVAAESYVIGGFGKPGSRVAFYDLWTWVGTTEHAMVVAAEQLGCKK